MKKRHGVVSLPTSLTPERIRELWDAMIPTMRDFDDSLRGWGRNRAKRPPCKPEKVEET